MVSKRYWRWLRLSRQQWFRASLFGVCGVGMALLGSVADSLLPAEPVFKVSHEAVAGVLNILASSMLAVTTFSLGILVAAYGSAISNATPRSAQLLTHDATAQNVLATFMGAFLFSLVGVVAESVQIYGDNGRLILFVSTLAVIVIVVITILRWIDHLAGFGGVGETTHMVEEALARALDDAIATPALGCRPLRSAGDIPDEAIPLHALEIGYIQHVDIEALAEASKEAGCRIYIDSLPGSFVHSAEPLVMVDREVDDDLAGRIRGAFTIGEERSFDQDPRFGISVLAEIASRALSPAMNDAGTAIDVIGRLVRQIAKMAHRAEKPHARPICQEVFAPPLQVSDLFNDAFTPIARDGAEILEVGMRLQKGLRALASMGDTRMTRAAILHSALALERSEAALTVEHDKKILRRLAGDVAAKIPKSQPLQ